MSDFLLEIGTEEIPARLVSKACEDLQNLFVKSLNTLHLADGATVSVEATPRRLVLFTRNLPPRQADRTETLTGPAQRIAFDDEGRPTRAALGFSRRAGVPVDELQVGDTGKLVARRVIPGRTARELLAESLVKVVLGLRFPRSMYWAGKGSPRFIRPIRWVVALLDGRIVPFTVAGVSSDRKTLGHRTLGPGPHTVNSTDDYLEVLGTSGVILSSEERGQKILSESEALLPADCRLRRNDRLLSTLVFETEFPTALLGEFDDGYLSLPDEVLETVMLVHQKYFAIENRAGRLVNRFVAVANSGGDPTGVIRAGHERVLRARFNDARFFWDFDQRRSLEQRVADLGEVTFQASLGSYRDKTEVNLAAAARIAAELGMDPASRAAARRALLLAKCDLTTEMVGEFPELQGKVGGLYAAAQGESQEVADAIYDHYLPFGASGPIPRNQVGQVASLADKLTTLGGMFGLGLIPTGSKDPLALRRAALSVIRIIIEGRMALSLDSLVEISGVGTRAPDLRGFLVERLRYCLRDAADLAPDVVQAVLTAGDDAPLDVLARGKALAEVRGAPEFEALAISFKRIRNLLGHAGVSETVGGGSVDTGLLEEGAEADLHAALERVGASLDAHRAANDYVASLREIAVLRPALDCYFDDVLVMVDDETVRRNRLAFLAGMLVRLSTIADFAAIAPELAAGKRR